MSQPIFRNIYVATNQNPYSTIKPSIRTQPSNLNQNFHSYKILRGRIIDKVQEVIVTLDSPNSSINRFIKDLNSKYGSERSTKIFNIIDKIYYNSDQILSTDVTDSYEFFKNMKNFIKHIDALSNEFALYLNTNDTVDRLNPLGAYENLIRISNDFNALDKAESNFPQNFRQSYVQNFQKIVNDYKS